ncbi:MAG: metalloregulator ArsR/SmtB family transcription factor [Planctomycetota bacterium]
MKPTKPSPGSPARDRVLHQLKARGPQTAALLAKRLSITSMAVRQHLAALESEGMVTFASERGSVGRPARIWQLTTRAEAKFPDSHGALTVDLLQAMRQAFGENGLQKLVEARTKAQIAAYREQLPDTSSPLEKRVAALAAIRRKEGYMAEWSRARDHFTLTENHCPICAAARECQGLCAGELKLFRAALGRGVKIERTEHLLEGARRCVYEIRSN